MNGEPETTPTVKLSSRIATELWWLVMVQAALLVTLLPTAMAFVIFDGGTTYAALFALFAIPVGPAIQSGIYALRRGKEQVNERPWSRFWEGWRTGWKQSLAVWLPAVALAGGALLLSELMPADSIARPLATVTFILAGVLTLCSLTALTIIGGFSFRTRDLVRVTLYVMGARSASTVGVIVLVLATAALLFIGFEAVLVLLAAVLCRLLLAVVRPMHKLIRDTLTSDSP